MVRPHSQITSTHGINSNQFLDLPGFTLYRLSRQFVCREGNVKAQVKRGLGLVCLFVWLCVMAHSAMAQPAYEPFNYPAGAAPGNGGTGWSGAWSPGSSQVVTPGLTFTGLTTAGNALGPSGAFASRQLQTPVVGVAGTSVILRALIKSNINGTPASHATIGNYPGGGSNVFSMGDLPMADANAGNWGIQNGCGNFYSNVPVVANQTVYLTAQIDFNVSGSNDRMRLWVQTSPPAAPTFTLTPDIDVLCNLNTFSGVYWQTQQSQIVDEIRVDTASSLCVAPPNTTMVAWYPFDESAGTASANLATGNTGKRIGSPIPVAGMVANGLHFDGINDYVEAPSTIVTNIGPAGTPQTCSGSYSTCRGDFSIDAWIRVDPSASQSVLVIIDKRSGSPPAINGYHFGVYQQNRLTLQLADGLGSGGYSTYVSPFLSPSLTDGQWHHVAVTVSRLSTTGIRWYHNGAAVTPFSNPTGRQGSLLNNSPLRIGTRTAASPLTGWFKGDIDELEIFNRVLTKPEVQGLYNAGPFGKCK